MKNLNKENFFNGIIAMYPRAGKSFCEFIDKYKESVDWRVLFNELRMSTNLGLLGEICQWTQVTNAPKFHEIPIEMQYGIILKWIMYSCIKEVTLIFPSNELHRFQMVEQLAAVFAEVDKKLSYEALNAEIAAEQEYCPKCGFLKHEGECTEKMGADYTYCSECSHKLDFDCECRNPGCSRYRCKGGCDCINCENARAEDYKAREEDIQMRADAQRIDAEWHETSSGEEVSND